MYEARFDKPHKQGLERLTGDNSGLFYTNERTEQVIDVETNESRLEFVYDVYEIKDARQKCKVKNEIVTSEHPFGDETKIIRKAISALLKEIGMYDKEEFYEFKAYNDFVESIK